MRIITMQMAARAAAAVGTPLPVESEKEFIVCSLDLISGMSEGLGASVEALVGASRLREFVLQCCAVSTQAHIQKSSRRLHALLSQECFTYDIGGIPKLLDLSVLPQHNRPACSVAAMLYLDDPNLGIGSCSFFAKPSDTRRSSCLLYVCFIV